MLGVRMMMATAGNAVRTYVDDVFSAYTYTGNGATQTITNGIDLAGKGGMVWTKDRVAARNHALYDTIRGGSKPILTNADVAEGSFTNDITSFNANGYGIAYVSTYLNVNTEAHVSWTFRNAPNFFNHSSVVKSSGSNATVSFPDLTTLGMVAVKRTDVAGSWYVWHRSLTAGKLVYLNTTAAETTDGSITVSGTTVTLVNGVIADGTYIVYAWAHDTSAEGIIQCGSVVKDGSNLASVTLGWEPQWVIYKKSSGAGEWNIEDVMRGSSQTDSLVLRAESSIAEFSNGGAPIFKANAVGFQLTNQAGSVGDTYDFMAIRRPNKTPTSGTQVYNAIARSVSASAATVTGVGFPPDLLIAKARVSASVPGGFLDRLRGKSCRLTGSTEAEKANSTGLTSFDMDGATFVGNGTTNDASFGYDAGGEIEWFFRRAPGFFDVVAYTGADTGLTVNHNLGVTPEMAIIKNRSNATGYNWLVVGASNTLQLKLNLTDAAGGGGTFSSVSPTTFVFNSNTNVYNSAGNTYVTYLFATLAGISKVGSYTGTAATLQINCGFTTGARFVLIKRTDSTGDWYVWDTVRGIIAGNDPYLLLNSTAAEVTSTDYIDPYSAGFEISSTAPAAINASGGTYIFLAIA